MIELFTSNTPNGKKITIMLEEINLDYKVTIVNINKNEQFNPKFREKNYKDFLSESVSLIKKDFASG